MIVAYTALHYGSPYLEYAIRSVIDYVDKYVVLYSPHGSHGHRVNGVTLPDSEHRENLQWIVYQAAKGKHQWVDGNWTHEGQQRDFIHTVCPDADLILVLDYDEIWPEALVKQVTTTLVGFNDCRNYRLPMIHYWRSFRRCVLHDPALPIRVINPHGDGECTAGVAPINHMGYAIPDWLVRYKWQIHGHKNELRQDIDWFADRWEINAQEDCHPVGSEFWTPETVDPLEYLPHWIVQHKYYGDEVIA